MSDMDTFGVIDLMTGYQGAATLTAAARLGVFDALAENSLTAVEVADRLGLDRSATLALLDALVGLNVLVSTGSGYANSPVSRRLAADGDLRLVAEKEAFFARVWLDLAESVRTGEPRLSPWRDRLANDPAQVRSFLQALVVLAKETGPDLTRLPAVRPGARVCDLGGGLGAYAVPLAAAGALVTLADLPPVIEWAIEELDTASAQARARITPVAVDIFSPAAVATIGGGYDLVLLSHLLHDLDDAECATVLTLAQSLLRPGATIAVFELPGDPPGSFGPMFDLMMRVETPGRARRTPELLAMLLDAGFTDVHLGDFQLPHGVVIGTSAAAGPDN